ncbi:MAG: hypothetical protein J6K17_00070 [Oscillospiraceae bacterium]|nr:hypothetical protein [Oscillospiraceae bacterium]
MTDAEIIKSLEACGGEGGCIDCTYRSFLNKADCIMQLENTVLDLIKCQQAKIEELEAKHWGECMQIAHYDDESKQYADIGKMYSEIRAKAVREFADALKSKSELVAPSVYASPYRAVSVDDIDILVKGKTGGETY